MRRSSRTLLRVIRNGLLGFIRNLSLAAAAIAVMVVTLTIILFSVIANAAFNETIAQINDKITISVYLNDSDTTAQVDSLQTQLEHLPNVKSISYVSKDQALAIFKSENPGNSSLAQAITESGGNPLPASLEISPINPNEIQDIKNFLDEPQNFSLQDPQAGTSYTGNEKEAIDKIAHATSLMKEAGAIAVVVFALISVLIIFNTIRMAIFNRRDEISIMRLLGASTWYIRGPFVAESMIYGIIAALASIGIIYVLFIGSSSALQASSLGLLDINYASSYFKGHFWLFLTLQFGLGILISAVSSVIATRRYLKLKTSK
jgi:cell division transport system permease protein